MLLLAAKLELLTSSPIFWNAKPLFFVPETRHFSGNLKINKHKYSLNWIQHEFYFRSCSSLSLSLTDSIFLYSTLMYLTIGISFAVVCQELWKTEKYLLFSRYFPLVQSQKLLPTHIISIIVRSLCNWATFFFQTCFQRWKFQVSHLNMCASSCWCLKLELFHNI